MNNDEKKAFDLQIIGLLIFALTYWFVPFNLIGLIIFCIGLRKEGK